MPKIIFALIFLTLNLATAAEDLTRTCGTESVSGDSVCLRYGGNPALEITRKDGSCKIEYRISQTPPQVVYRGKDLVITTYQYDPSEKGAEFVMTTRLLNEPKYPGDADYEILSLEGNTPGKYAEKFSAKYGK